MSSRALALLAVSLVSTAAAEAQAPIHRIAGPTPGSVSVGVIPRAPSGFPSAALGHEAMHRAGRRPNVTGGLIGFVVGAAAGAAVGCLANKDDYGVFCAGQNDTKVVVGALVGGVAGAAVGALLFQRH